MTLRYSCMIRVEVFFSLFYMLFDPVTDRQTLSIMDNRYHSWTVRKKYKYYPQTKITITQIWT